ncbi:GNAT family N-acetyltransferase [Candidatus Woesearchaeota archaeon]|nr:GNAT family N-acetyltransferase [Candidatus Woesearchaeota archaeon]
MGIRKATLKELPLLVKINRECDDIVQKKLLRMTDEYLTKEFKCLFNDKNYEFFVYNNTGFILFNHKFCGNNNCEVYWLVVSKQFQGKGIGTKLMKFIEKYAKKKKFNGIYLYTHPIRKNTLNFYKKLGYHKVNEFPDYYINGDTSFLFGKRLK